MGLPRGNIEELIRHSAASLGHADVWPVGVPAVILSGIKPGRGSASRAQ
jgi:hypothetical protein